PITLHLYVHAGCCHKRRTRFMRLSLKLFPAAGLFLLTACVSHPPPSTRQAPADLPGQRADGSVLLPNQWSLRPVGIQVVLGDFPVNIAVHPDNRFVAVLHSGHGRHEIAVVDVSAAKVVGEFPLEESFYGLEFSRDGKELYCSGASAEVISDESPFPYACRLDEKRQRLYVSLWAKAAVAVVDLKANQVSARWATQEHPCEMLLTSSGRILYVANAARNSVTVFDTGTGK